jgi:ATP-dependent exoDNAse (exonuclease V) beta subunit
MNFILNFKVDISNPIKFSHEAIYKEKNNFINFNKRNNKIQIGKRNYDMLDCNLNWGALVHKYLELTIPSDYDLLYKDQVGNLINELDKKELKNLDEIFQNIINRKELSFLFNEKVYKSAINEFTFMLDQKTFVIDRIVEFEHKIYVLDYKIGLLKKIKKDLIENFKKQITNYIVAVKKIYPNKEIIGVLIYLDKTVFM